MISEILSDDRTTWLQGLKPSIGKLDGGVLRSCHWQDLRIN
jgi:hypothetical protein